MSHQDVEVKTGLLEDEAANADRYKHAHFDGMIQRQGSDRRRSVRRAQTLLVVNLAMGLLLCLAVASFSVKPGHSYPWMPHRLQRVFLCFFATEMLLFFVIPPIFLLWRFGGRTAADLGTDQRRDFACIILLAVSEFLCGLWASSMSAISIYSGSIVDGNDAWNGLVTLCSFGMGACLFFSLFGNPKFRSAKRLDSRALQHEAELSVTGAIMNMMVALSAALALAQSSIPGQRFSVLGIAEYPIMFLGAYLLVKSIAHLATELLRHRKAARSAAALTS